MTDHDKEKSVDLTEEEERRLAKLIVDEMINRVYTEVGKSILKKIFWGAILVGLAIAISTGVIKIP